MSETTPLIHNEQHYPPSWIDRLNSRVQELPVRAPLFFAVAGLALLVVQLLLFAVTEQLPASTYSVAG